MIPLPPDTSKTVYTADGGGVPWRHDELFQEPWDRLEEKEDEDR